MNKEAKDWLEKMGITVKNVKFDETPITSKKKKKKMHNDLYDKSSGSVTDKGLCFFINEGINPNTAISKWKGTLHTITNEAEIEIANDGLECSSCISSSKM